VISISWDPSGSGAFAQKHDDVNGSATSETRATSHRFDTPGTYFVTALAECHREGDVAATSRHIPNLGQVRVVVR